MFNFTDYTYQLSYIFDRSLLTYKDKYSNYVIHVNQKIYYKGVDKHYDVYKYSIKKKLGSSSKFLLQFTST